MRARLLKTSVFRLTLQYTAVYAIVLVVLFSILYLSSSRYVNDALRKDIEQEFQALSRVFDADGGGHLAEIIDGFMDEALRDGRFYLLAAGNGRPLAGNLTKWPNEANVLFDEVGVSNIWLDDDIMVGDFFQNDAYLPAIARELPDGSRLLLAYGVEQDNVLRELSENLLESMGAVIFSALLMGFLLGRAVLRRIDAINMTAAEIMDGELSRRIPITEKNDEFDGLSQRLNDMLERIEEVMIGMREVTDSVAHDLRSPITRIRNRMDVTLLQEGLDEKEYRHVLEQTVKDSDMMIKTFNAVLQTAQANAGTIRADLSPVDLARLVREMGELFTPVVEESGHLMKIACGESTWVTGNRNMLAQAIGNLLDNAIKYTPRGGSLRLALVCHDGLVDVVVEDNGPGIPEQEYQRVRQRFVRLNAARETEGNGLGLSFVDAIARLHGAPLIFEDGRPGLRAIIRFQAERPGRERQRHSGAEPLHAQAE